MRVKTLDDEGQRAVAEMIENGYVLTDKSQKKSSQDEIVPFNTPAKEIKLYKQPLQKLVDERERLRLKFTPRNGGMGGIPLSVRNRIERLEKVIENKVNLINEAIKKNESGSTSEES
tara:strand:+ start:322 stop:672 length:351 start_codon:yes stop_codon:yes gene_type:complete